MTVRNKKTATRSADVRGSSNFGVWLIIASIIIVALVVVLITLNNRPATPATEATTATKGEMPAEWINGMSMGNPEAKVVLQAWEDFLCPHCRNWTDTMEPKLVNDYIKTGKARLEYHPFPLSGFMPASGAAALAAFCAADQNQFWPMHDRLFGIQKDGMLAYTPERLIELANEIKLKDLGKFQQCVISQQHQADVDTSISAGRTAQVEATPTLFVNGKKVENPIDYDAIKVVIETALAGK